METMTVVLVEPSHPGNIGATARAMHTMGLAELVLVNPACFPHPDATARAAGADGILDRAQTCATLEQALVGREWVLGMSARQRSIEWPMLSPREAAERAATEYAGRAIALVFGRERTGLENDELERCHALVSIPANPDYSSLNLAAAVQVIAYEMRLAHRVERDATVAAQTPLATAEEMELFHAHLERVMLDTGFLDPDNPRHLTRRLRRLFNRAQPDANELNILRGILSSVEKPTGPRHR